MGETISAYKIIEKKEDNRLTVVEKKQPITFTLEDLDNYIKDIESEKSKAHAYITHSDSIIENIKAFHPEVVAYYEGLIDEKKTAMLEFCKAVIAREKQVFTVKNCATEIDKLNIEIKEVNKLFN